MLYEADLLANSDPTGGSAGPAALFGFITVLSSSAADRGPNHVSNWTTQSQLNTTQHTIDLIEPNAITAISRLYHPWGRPGQNLRARPLRRQVQEDLANHDPQFRPSGRRACAAGARRIVRKPLPTDCGDTRRANGIDRRIRRRAGDLDAHAACARPSWMHLWAPSSQSLGLVQDNRHCV